MLDRTGRAIGHHRGHHNFTVGQRRGIGVSASEPLYVFATDAANNTVTVGTPRGIETRRGRGSATRSYTATAPASTQSGFAITPQTVPAAIGRAATGRSQDARAEALRSLRRRLSGSDCGAAWHGEAIVGHGTITAAAGLRSPPRASERARRPYTNVRNRRLSLDEGPADPRHLPLVLRGAGSQDRALGLAGALRARPHGAADDRRHAALQALLPRPREPPAPRLADVQKCFRTTDIEEVGNTARHLTFFEMLGNWSFGDYFKAESIPWGWQLATEGFGMDPERIWVTVFGGDEELGLGPDDRGDRDLAGDRASPIERIVRLGREDNFWQARADRSVRSVLGALPRPRPRVRHRRANAPATRASASSSSGTTSSCPMTCRGRDADRAADSKNIDTGMGLDRMAAIFQGVPRSSRPTCAAAD